MSLSAVYRAPLGAGLLAACLSLPAAAQTTSAVSGVLLDRATQQPLPFANVVLLRAQDSTLVTGAQTGETGAFRLERVPAGQYLLRASVLGYQPLRRAVSVAAGSAGLNLGTVALAPTTQQLQGVTVTAERETVVDDLNKRVVNVAKDLTSVGGTAVNVLQNVPSVSVDQNGQVALRGTSNVTIYIDGKPTGATGNGGAANLSQIPASSIESVEVITNPGAKYEAAGGGGIINIVLKKEKKDGFNGNAALNVGTREKYNATLGLNRRQGRFNWFGSYDYRSELYGTDVRVVQQTSNDAWITDNDQIAQQYQRPTTHAGRLGFDFTASPTQTLSLTVQPRYNLFDNGEDQWANLVYTRRTTGATTPSTLFIRSATTAEVGSIDGALDYRRTWAEHKGRELTANAFYSFVKGNNLLDQKQNEGQPTDELLQRQPINFVFPQGSAQVDYVQPVGAKGRVEAGLRGQIRGTDGQYVFEQFSREQNGYRRFEERSIDYRFFDYIKAGYLTYQNEAGALSYQAGLRAEHTSFRGLVRNTGTRYERDYLDLFPSASVAYNLPAEQRVQLSFARRLNRPDVPQLLPLRNYSDPRNLREGNPLLRPEYIHTLELGHQKSWGKATLSSTLFYRETRNQIQRFREVATVDKIQRGGEEVEVVNTLSTFVNVGYNRSYGLELNLNQPLTDWWRLTANGSAFGNEVSTRTNTELDGRNLVYNARVNTTFTPTKKLDLQLTGNYRSATLTAQGRISPIYFLDFAAKYSVLQDRGALTLRVSDVFDSQQFDVDAYGPGLNLDLRIKRETRVAFLGFSYRFGSEQGTQPRPRRRGEQQSGGSGVDF